MEEGPVHRQEPVEPEHCAEAPQEPVCAPPPPKRTTPPKQTARSRQETAAGDFLRRLLPQDLDTGDLIVILLLLLMAGDCQEDRNTALLTLAIYMFM